MLMAVLNIRENKMGEGEVSELCWFDQRLKPCRIFDIGKYVTCRVGSILKNLIHPKLYV